MGDFFMFERSIVLMNMYSWDQENPEEKAKMDQLFLDLHEEAKKRGYGMYRAPCSAYGYGPVALVVS